MKKPDNVQYIVETERIQFRMAATV